MREYFTSSILSQFVTLRKAYTLCHCKWLWVLSLSWRSISRCLSTTYMYHTWSYTPKYVTILTLNSRNSEMIGARVPRLRQQHHLRRTFIHLVVCLTIGPKPLPKRAVHIVRSRASSFKWEYPLLSLRSSNSFLRLLPCLPVTSIPPLYLSLLNINFFVKYFSF